MSDSMQGLSRTHYCGTLSAADIGQTVTVMGWVQKQRDLGSLIFVDVRDRTGIVQLNFNETTHKELFDKAFTLRAEYVVAAKGIVAARGEAAVNRKMATGEIEIMVEDLRLLNTAATPPFEIVENSDVREELRLKYRYLDLRRPELTRSLMLRHRTAQAVRRYLDEQGFLEIETPMLIRSTPEGARDYLVPSRVHQGTFYALPQSPQLYKQLLMVGGYDRYMQITRCFRDEDLRADRQPEFTQIDMEMSFVNEEDVIALNEGLLSYVFKNVLDVELKTPFQRMTWQESMDRFGSDHPDLRFGLELCDLSDLFAQTSFKVFAGALEAGGSVRCIRVPGGASAFTRKDLDKLTEWVKTYKAKGLAWLKLQNGEVSSSYAKFLTEEENNAVAERMGLEDGDLLLVVADGKNSIVYASLGALRCEIAKRLGLIDKTEFRFVWITEFPLLEYDEDAGRYVAAHHPFTSPMAQDVPLMEPDPGKVRARAYDIVLNGFEIGGGSIRIHNGDLQQKMFALLGFSQEEAQRRFGFLLEAFKYGAPPHGGLAYGFDRLVMLMAGLDAIRDVIAFPKVQNASELMTDCPSEVDGAQLRELALTLDLPVQNS